MAQNGRRRDLTLAGKADQSVPDLVGIARRGDAPQAGGLAQELMREILTGNGWSRRRRPAMKKRGHDNSKTLRPGGHNCCKD